MSSASDPQRFERLLALVEAGKRLPLAERTAFLARESAGDLALRAEAQSLLDAEARSGASGRAPSVAVASPGRPVPPAPPASPHAAASAPTSALEPGEPNLAAKRLGDCTLTRRLAGGGMGVVYEAIQDPPGRVVAVKVLRAALAGDEGRLRFAHEARVLGRLRHPGIAQIYESGTTTDDGGEELPYFVMEHVPGAQTLLEHAAAKGLDTKARLALFARVCEAVHFGHTKGVIHRDLKPGNVLVDADGAPKVIDFGIARSTLPDTDGHATPHTETGLLVGTLQYMSPEQVAGARADVDTRSDVYALGVILYELLTGRLPYDLEGLGLVEVARAITTSPPLPPQRFAPDTQGDLTVILGKALAKEPTQRYASAEALGQDLQRYLAFTPIQARPPSLTYQLRLFARRHRAAFAASIVGALALLGAAIVSIWFATREAAERKEAERQRQRAEGLLSQTRELVPWLLREFNGEIARLPGSVTPRSKLAARLQEHLDALALTDRDHPSVLDAAVEARAALGDVLGGAGGGNLGKREEAVAQYTQALDLLARREEQGADATRVALQRARLLVGRAGSLKELGDLAGATRDLDAGLATLAKVTIEGNLDAARLDAALLDVELRTRRADMDWYAERYAEALPAYREVLKRWTGPELAGAPEAERRRGTALAHLTLAQCLLELRMAQEAAPHLQAVSQAARAIEAEVSPASSDLTLLYYLHDNVGRGLLETGELGEATERFQAALAAAERRRAHDPADVQGLLLVHNAHMLLASTALDQGEHALALERYARAMQVSDTLAVGEPPGSSVMWDRRLALTQMGRAHLALGQVAQAEACFERALPLAEARAEALPVGDSFLGLRDVLAQHSNAALRRFRGALQVQPMLVALVQSTAPWGAPDLGATVSTLCERAAERFLRTARERLARARTALVHCKDLPGWTEGHERDLVRTDASLAAMDEGLTTFAR